jgi:hypothetical protein
MTDYENDFNDREYDDTNEQNVDNDDYQIMINMKVRMNENPRLTSVRLMRITLVHLLLCQRELRNVKQ